MDHKYRQDLIHKYIRTSRMSFHKTHEHLEVLGLYRGQPPLLFALWHEDGLSRKELVDRLKKTPATITKMVGRLEKTGFVTSRPDERDSRVSRVYLTQEGKGIETKVNETFEHLSSEIFKSFTNEELDQFGAMLSKINDNIEAMPKLVKGEIIHD